MARAVIQAAAGSAASGAGGPGWLLGSLITLVGIAILTAVLYTFWSNPKGSRSSVGIIRALLALVLVGALVILAGASFSSSNSDTSNLLIGGVVASASGAVAFYFATRGAQDAQKDVLSAALGMETVPVLTALTVTQAQTALSKTSLKLQLPTAAPAADYVIKTQDIPPGTSVGRGTTVSVT